MLDELGQDLRRVWTVTFRRHWKPICTALMCVGAVCMLVAVGLLWFAGSKLAPDGMPLKVQDNDPKTRIQLPG